ncbi:DUF1992 domain-containing protein [Kineococcus gypseus]|uniref:DnaJ family domain-containing protein n=1 Tax=Kineococcus gypseus TaxID=1637102 RepID=UPI003D7C4396
MRGWRPAGRFEDRVERQVREAVERGDFDHLPGAGAPLRGLDRPFTADGWAADKARREGFDVSAMLPPALALRREREVLLRDVGELRSPAEVEEVAEDFNARVRELYRRGTDGPFVVVALLDPADLRARWGAARPAPPPAPPQPAAPAPGRRWSRWLPWRRQRRGHREGGG